jgi:hypothetical protein
MHRESPSAKRLAAEWATKIQFQTGAVILQNRPIDLQVLLSDFFLSGFPTTI